MNLKLGPLFRDKFFGAPYKLGGQSKEEGFDCASFVDNYYKELGNEFPDLSDLYSIIHAGKSEKARELLWRRLFKVTESIPLGYVQPGDLVVFEVEDFGDYPGIYLGNGIVGACFTDRGVTTVKYDSLNVIQVRRWKD